MNNIPLVIGGSGGSGTRAVAQVFMKAGYYLGPDLQINSFDAKNICRFYDKWIKSYLISDDIDDEMRKDFEEVLKIHLMDTDNIRWGWKEPRTIFFIPFTYQYFPDMKFIHVIRDGRDMAYSQNYRQPKELFDIFFDVKWFPEFCYEAAVMFWVKTNIMAKKIGLQTLGDNYLCIKLEDLCSNTKETISRMMDFVNFKSTNIEDLISCVETPVSIGRWKRDPVWINKLHNLAYIGLKEFGYDV